jgi:hypothetical protein
MHIGHTPFDDKEIRKFINDSLKTISIEEVENFKHSDFDRTFRNWLESSTQNKIDLSGFPYSSFMFASLSGWPEFLARHHSRRVRSSSDDFLMTKILAKNYNMNYLPLESGSLDKDDVLVISHPFSGNGAVMPKLFDILDEAEKLMIPTMLDCAYFGIGHGFEYPLHYKCITDCVFSLSKNFGTTHFRLGARFTRDNRDDGLTCGLLSSDIYNKHGALLTCRLLEKFSHDWFINKWKDVSSETAKELGLIDTNCVTLKTSNKPLPKFQRGNYVRVCISDELSNK